MQGQAFIDALKSITDPHDIEQLRTLQQVSEAHRDHLGRDEIRAIFDLFERFPQEDGYGIFWSFLHEIEASGNYEQDLVASILRVPGDFNLMMICRLLNAGIFNFETCDLNALLAAVAARPDISLHIRETALGHIKPHESH